MNKTILTVLCALLVAARAAHAQGTAFTYQGRLNTATSAATGLYDLSFNLYAFSSGGPALTASNGFFAVPVTGGVFTVTLNFGDQFPGADRWLGIAVRTNGTGNFAPLEPRQLLTPTPYAITARNLSGPLPASQLSGALASAQLSGTYSGAITLNNAANQLTGAHNGSGAGLINLNASNLNSGIVSDLRLPANAALLNRNPQIFGGQNYFLGNVGIGNVSPLNLLSVSGDANFNGSVGIGIGNPSARIHVAGAVQGLALLEGAHVGGTWLNLRNTSAGGREWNFISSGSGNGEGPGKLLFRDTAHGVVMTLSTNGNVGVGTDAPQEKFHLAGKFVRVDGLGDERAYVGGDGIGGDVQLGSLNSAINNVLLWNTGNNTAMDLIADQITANQFNGPLNGSLSGTFNGGVTASNFKLGSSSTAGSVLTASDGIGNVGFQSNLRVFDAGFSTDNGNIAGGRHNTLGAGIVGAVIAGGGTLLNPNQVSGSFGAVGGGSANSAGNLGTVPGGSANAAAGQYSFAAGRRAKANHQGTYVWADSQNSDFASTGNNQFLIRALFGVGINTPSPAVGFALDVNGTAQIRNTLVVDADNANAGSIYPGLSFGANSGEGICSRRTSGDNQYGLDFYTASTRRFSIGLGGGMNLHDNTLLLRGTGDANHGLGFRSTFATHNVDGPALFGYAGGALGTTEGGENWSLRWNKTEVRVKVLTIEGGADVAEPFPMKEEDMEPGSVVVIDDEYPGRLRLSTEEYDTRVAGIVSGAGGVKPGIALHQQGLLEGDKNVALTGRVYVKADASLGAIKPGDLLTTSARPGHAMKVAEHGRSQGAILGKAMSALNEGTGLVLVLVTLQ